MCQLLGVAFCNISNNISDFLLKGSKAKKKLDKHPDCALTNWDNLAQVLNGDLLITDLPSTSRSTVSSPQSIDQDSQQSPLSGRPLHAKQKLPPDESTDSDYGSIDFAASVDSDGTRSTKKKTKKKADAGLIKAVKSTTKAILSITKPPPKKKARVQKDKIEVFVVDGNFPLIDNNGANFIKSEIEKYGGKIMQSLSKNVGESFYISAGIALSLSRYYKRLISASILTTWLVYLVAGENSKKAKLVREQNKKYKHISIIEIDKSELLRLEQQETTLEDLIFISSRAVIQNVDVNECAESGGIEVAARELFPG